MGSRRAFRVILLPSPWTSSWDISPSQNNPADPYREEDVQSTIKASWLTHQGKETPGFCSSAALCVCLACSYREALGSLFELNKNKVRISVQIRSVDSNVIELYWHIINGTFQIDIDSKNHTVDICSLWKIEWSNISCCAWEFLSLFQVPQWLLPTLAPLLQGTAQVGCTQGCHLKCLPAPHAHFCSLSFALQHCRSLSCPTSFCHEGLQKGWLEKLQA